MIRPAEPRDASLLVALWRRSVQATHDFLAPSDIKEIEGEVQAYLSSPIDIWVLIQDAKPIGFIGLSGAEIAALFVDDRARGRGAGTRLIQWAIERGCSRVEVNEQNSQAIGFYERMGFHRTSRAACDSAGRPFPVISMARGARV